MAAPISMEGFRSLERHEQVRALADAEFLGMAVTKHYAARSARAGGWYRGFGHHA